jgi:hypothetical protein
MNGNKNINASYPLHGKIYPYLEQILALSYHSFLIGIHVIRGTFVFPKFKNFFHIVTEKKRFILSFFK